MKQQMNTDILNKQGNDLESIDELSESPSKGGFENLRNKLKGKV